MKKKEGSLRSILINHAGRGKSGKQEIYQMVGRRKKDFLSLSYTLISSIIAEKSNPLDSG